MVAIDSLDDLREALRGLTAQKYLQADGPLDRRGVEVDHNFYQPAENKRIAAGGQTALERDEPRREVPQRDRGSLSSSNSRSPAAALNEVETNASPAAREMESGQNELRGRIDALEVEVRRLKGIVDDLCRDLRG